MRSLRLGELRDLLHGPAFAAWWTDWQDAAAAVRDARARHDDLRSQSELMAHRSELVQRAAAEGFARAGEAEDEGARRQAEAHADDGFERSLAAAERALEARRIRRGAERLREEAEQRRARAVQLAAEADRAARELREASARQEALLAGARERLGCVPGSSFLYWRREDDPASAFAIALADDPEGANIEVKALGIYRVGRRRGVAFLEPARDELAR